MLSICIFLIGGITPLYSAYASFTPAELFNTPAELIAPSDGALLPLANQVNFFRAWQKKNPPRKSKIRKSETRFNYVYIHNA